jgi:hypothetical protein
LVVELPERPYREPAVQVAPVYMDAFEEPGRLLYRFDAVLRNHGGTLDIIGDAAGRARQAIWASGFPRQRPDPAAAASGTGLVMRDLASTGARFEYVAEKTHAHWHFFTAAAYELRTSGGLVRRSDKVGFCFFDWFGPATYFPPPDWSDARSATWCAFDRPDATVVRMGLSPGAADRYAAQREFQWVDATGLEPGPVTLRGIANPYGHLHEGGATNNNVLDVQRVLPGVSVGPVTVEADASRPVEVGLSAAVIAPEVPARAGAGCEPAAESAACYVFAAAHGPVSFRVVRAPSHGSVTLTRSGALGAVADYTPTSGFSGIDRFEYVATDARGLTSPPATVTVHLAAPQAPETPRDSGEPRTDRPPSDPAPTRPPRGPSDPAPTTPPPDAKPSEPRQPLASRLAVRRHRGRWQATFDLTARVAVRIRVDRVQRQKRILVRTLHRRLSAGRHAIALGDLTRNARYRLQARVTRGAERQQLTYQFSAAPSEDRRGQRRP